MRNPWRLLLLRSYSRSPLNISTSLSHSHFHSQVLFHSSPISISSLFHTHSHNHKFHSLFNSQTSNKPTNPRCFSFSTEAALEPKDPDHVLPITDIFAKAKTLDEITKDLELNGVVITHEFVLKSLGILENKPDVAVAFFEWVSRNDGEKLSSKSYNLLLGVLGVNGLVKEFWDLVETMKKKGYGVSKGVHDKVVQKFEKEGLQSDLEKLRGLYAKGSVDNSMENICLRVCRVIRSGVWGDDVENRLRELNVTFSSDLVKMVLENVGTEPIKAFIFFRWVEESGLIKHDEQTYNVMATVLGREDCIDRFWKVVDEMRSGGYEMEMATYVKVLGRFYKRKMIKAAVDLYEFAMGGVNKPLEQDCRYLLKKIVVSKDLDIGLFSKVVRIFRDGGNVLTNSMLDAVLKSLRSVGRLGECNRILKAMEEGGFVANGTLQSKIAFQLSSAGKKDEASKFMFNVEESGWNPNFKTWASLIEGHCVAGDLDAASDCFQKMVDRDGVSHVGYALEVLVDAFCCKNRAIDACNLLSNMVIDKQLKPWHSTYKTLISKLLVQGGFQEALNLLSLMKNHGFPPYLDPFIEHISKAGTGDDAIIFLKAMTVKRFPSTSVFLRLFEAFFKVGRHNEAQDFLSKCPGYIRNHADVLNLFCSMKSREAAAVSA